MKTTRLATVAATALVLSLTGYGYAQEGGNKEQGAKPAAGQMEKGAGAQRDTNRSEQKAETPQRREEPKTGQAEQRREEPKTGQAEQRSATPKAAETERKEAPRAAETERKDAPKGATNERNESPKAAETNHKEGAKGAANERGETNKAAETNRKDGPKGATNERNEGSRAAETDRRNERKPGQAEASPNGNTQRTETSGNTQRSETNGNAQRNETRTGDARGRDVRVNGRVNVSQEKASRVSETLMERGHRENLNISVNVGERLPERVTIYPVPEDIVEIAPEYRGYDYVIDNDEIVFVSPESHEVVGTIGYEGRAAADESSSTLRRAKPCPTED